MNIGYLIAALILAVIVCACAVWSVLSDEGGDSHDFDIKASQGS